MKVYVLKACLLVTDYDDSYSQEDEEVVVAVTDTLVKAEELREEFNNLPENTNNKGIVRVIGIEERELNQLYNYHTKYKQTKGKE